jgi:hypothetical protein
MQKQTLFIGANYMKIIPILPLLALAAGTIQIGSASLISIGTTPTSGAGLGTVNTILTVTSPGNTSTETGCVGASSVGAQVIGSSACFGGALGGDEQTGASQTQLRTIGQSGAIDASSFLIVLNTVEPGGDSITLDQLSVRFYSPTGTVLYTASTSGSINFPATFTGIGNAGFGFQLDSAQAAAATAASVFASSSNLIGLSASLSNATGGHETFFVGSVASGGGGGGAGGPTPEPGTLMLLGGALFTLGLSRRFKKA